MFKSKQVCFRRNKSTGFAPLGVLVILAVVAIAASGAAVIWQKQVAPTPCLTIQPTFMPGVQTPTPTPSVQPPRQGPYVSDPVFPDVFEGDLRDLPTTKPFPEEYMRPLSEVACQTTNDCYDEDGMLKGVCSAPCVASCVAGRCVNVSPPGGICLAKDILISTPEGEVPVQDLREEMRVWTTDAEGRRRAASIIKTAQVFVPPNYRTINLTLLDGRRLFVSPGHPTADGRTLGQLLPGDILDDSRIATTELVSYQEDYTYDLLPAGGTGFYWANGILLKSTLLE